MRPWEVRLRDSSDAQTPWNGNWPHGHIVKSKRRPEQGSPLLELPRELRNMIYAELARSDWTFFQNDRLFHSPLFVQSIHLPLFPEPQILRINRQVYEEYADHVSKLMRNSTAKIWVRNYPAKLPPELGEGFMKFVPLLKLVGSVTIASEWGWLANESARSYVFDYILNAVIMHLDHVKNVHLEGYMQSRADRFSKLSPNLRGLLDYYPQRVDNITSVETFSNYRACPTWRVPGAHTTRSTSSAMYGDSRSFDKIEKSLLTNWHVVQGQLGVTFRAHNHNAQLFFRRTEMWEEGVREPEVITYRHPWFKVSSVMVQV